MQADYGLLCKGALSSLHLIALTEMVSSEVQATTRCCCFIGGCVNQFVNNELRNDFPGPLMLLPKSHESTNAHEQRFYDDELTSHALSDDTN